MSNLDQNMLAHRFRMYGSVPTPEVWKGIEAQLAKEEKKRSIIWWTVANAAAVAGILFGSYYLTSHKNETAQLADKQNQESPDQKEIQPINIANKELNEVKNIPPVNNITGRGKFVLPELPEKLEVAQNTPDEVSPILEKIEIGTENMDLAILELKTSQEISYSPALVANNILTPPTKTKAVHNEIGGSIGSFNTFDRSFAKSMEYSAPIDTVINVASTNEVSTRKILEANVFAQHQVNRWGLRAGVSGCYTITQSSYVDEIEYTTKNRILSIGIPVQLSFRFLNRPKFKMDAVAGIRPEYGFGRSTSSSVPSIPASTFDNGLSENSTNTRFAMSIEPAIEASIPVSSRFKILGRVGYRHYVRNGFHLSEGPARFAQVSLGTAYLF